MTQAQKVLKIMEHKEALENARKGLKELRVEQDFLEKNIIQIVKHDDLEDLEVRGKLLDQFAKYRKSAIHIKDALQNIDYYVYEAEKLRKAVMKK